MVSGEAQSGPHASNQSGQDEGAHHERRCKQDHPYPQGSRSSSGCGGVQRPISQQLGQRSCGRCPTSALPGCSKQRKPAQPTIPDQTHGHANGTRRILINSRRKQITIKTTQPAHALSNQILYILRTLRLRTTDIWVKIEEYYVTLSVSSFDCCVYSDV